MRFVVKCRKNANKLVKHFLRNHNTKPLCLNTNTDLRHTNSLQQIDSGVSCSNEPCESSYFNTQYKGKISSNPKLDYIFFRNHEKNYQSLPMGPKQRVLKGNFCLSYAHIYL